MRNHMTAIFDTRETAERVITELRTIGISDRDISIVARHTDNRQSTDTGESTGVTTGKGLAAGAGLGALFGLAAAFIPGVGPFIAAGALATALGTAGASAVAGAVLGGTAGAMSGALTNAGFPEKESRYYGEELERGGVLVSASLEDSAVSAAQVHEVFNRHSGRTAPVKV